MVKVFSEQNSEMHMSVSDMRGRKLQQHTIALRPGSNSIKINTSTLPAGAYLLSAYVAGEESQTIQFIKQ
jgi:hypothetical protein